MLNLTPVSKIFILTGVILIVTGILINFGFGGLPGDVYIKKDNFALYFPVVSCIVISIIISLVLFSLRK